jgi:dihydroorotase
MSKTRKQVVRKSSNKKVLRQNAATSDAGKIRFGNGSAPRVLRGQDAATQDSGAIRFGNGSAPAILRK